MSRPKLLDLPGGRVLIDASDLLRLDGKSIYIGSNGYAYYGRAITLHSFVLGPIAAGLHIDHINGNKLDNRRENLRSVTPQVNQANRKKLNRNNTSGIRGVQFSALSAKNPWRAQITVNRRAIHLGLFASREAAIEARREAELSYFGELCP